MNRAILNPFFNQFLECRHDYVPVAFNLLREKLGIIQQGNTFYAYLPVSGIFHRVFNDLFQFLQTIQILIPLHLFKGIIFIEQPLRQHAHHFFLRLMIERPSCQSSQMIHNIKDGCILIAFFQKQFQRDIQYLFYRFFRIFISRHILTSFTYTLYVYNSIE